MLSNNQKKKFAYGKFVANQSLATPRIELHTQLKRTKSILCLPWYNRNSKIDFQGKVRFWLLTVEMKRISDKYIPCSMPLKQTRLRRRRRVCVPLRPNIKPWRLKGVFKLYRNEDPVIKLVPKFKEQAKQMGGRSLGKEAFRFAELNLEHRSM